MDEPICNRNWIHWDDKGKKDFSVICVTFGGWLPSNAFHMHGFTRTIETGDITFCFWIVCSISHLKGVNAIYFVSEITEQNKVLTFYTFGKCNGFRLVLYRGYVLDW